METVTQKRGPIVASAVVTLIVIIGMVAWVLKTSSRYNPHETATVGVVRIRPEITLDQFLSLPDGASYNHVTALLRDPGIEVSRNNIAGYLTVMYQWENADGSNMNAMFQNDRLVSKSQAGLK